MANAIEPFANISAQELLKNTPRLFGWARKEDTGGLRSVVKALDWPWRYMILSAGCLYLYKSSDDHNFSEAIPLTKFRVCEAPDKSKYPWAFKLIHESTDVKTLFFAVDSDFDLKKWQDAITEEKIKYCCDGLRDDADGYSTIDEEPVRQTPPPPPRAQSMRERPPAPLPQRPHSNSSPLFLADCNRSSNPLPTPPRRLNPDFPQNPVSKPKPLTLPRPPNTGPKLPARPLSMGTFSRRISEPSSTAKPPQGYDKVVNQLTSASLRSPEKEGPVSSVTPSSNIGLAKKIRRGAPDGQSFKGKERDRVLPHSAWKLDLDNKTEINSLLKNQQGVYFVRKSVSAQSEMALSVWIGDRVRHYVIFYNEGTGYAFDPDGPRFDTMENLIRHYYDNYLPKSDAKFTRPYQ